MGISTGDIEALSLCRWVAPLDIIQHIPEHFIKDLENYFKMLYRIAVRKVAYVNPMLWDLGPHRLGQ